VAAKLHGALTVGGKHAEAERLASNWLKGRPKDLRFLSQLGDQAMARRDYAGAEAMYRRALDASPGNAAMLNNVAYALARQGKPGAVELAEKANALSPNQPAFVDTLAYSLAMSGQGERAIELQKALVSRQPGVPFYRLNLARIYIKAGQKAQAEAELNELAKLGARFQGQAEVAQLLRSLKQG
jgi:predicted Zn-dependent protease